MRPLVLAVPLALALSACSGSSQQATPRSPEPTLPTAPPTSAAPTPTATAAPVPSPTASATPTPSPARRRPAAEGDVDGDGKADVVRATETLLRVTLSSTGATVTAPVHTESPGSPAVLGSADVDRDGFAEVFLETAQGASTSFATPYRFDGRALRELQLDGGPVRLGIGGSVTHGDGFRCTSGGLLEVRRAESQDGQSFTVHVDTYRLAAAELVLVRSATASAKQGDPAVEASYTAECGSVGDTQ